MAQHWDGTEGPGGPCDTVFRNEELRVLWTFYGAEASDWAMVFCMGTGIRQNEEYLDPVKLVSVGEQVTVSEFFKGRWQKRVDVEVVLRRAVQFTYAVLNVGAAYGTIVSEEVAPIEWSTEEVKP